MRLSRRSLLLAAAALPLVGCGDGGTISRFETSGDTARPGGVGLAQPVRVSYAVRRPALVAAVVRGPAGREWPLRDATPRAPGEQYELSFDGTVPVGTGDREVLGDGAYELRLKATEPDGTSQERTAPVTVAGSEGRALELRGPTVAPPLITPDGDGVDDEVKIGFELSQAATVEISAESELGERAAILAPVRRDPGPGSVLWDGSAGGRVFGGKRLPDGKYTVTVTARDDAGNVRVRQAPLRISNGGIERLEIADASITPERIRLGDQLRVRIKVINSGETTLRTMGPPPGTAYKTSQSYSTVLGPGGRPLEIVSGAWRVGLGWRDADQELPLRWGLLADPGGTIPPGGSATIEAVVTVDKLPPTIKDSARFWVGAIREGVGMTSGRVGDQVVTIQP